jgi:hypothetical protein
VNIDVSVASRDDTTEGGSGVAEDLGEVALTGMIPISSEAACMNVQDLPSDNVR